MNNPNRKLWLATALAISFVVSCRCAVVAPAVFPPCIIQYSSQRASDMSTSSRIVLYKGDRTYIELAVSSSNLLGSGSSAPHSGSFTYAVDAQNPNHASIIYGGGSGSLSNDELYFITPTGGSLSPVVTTAGAGGAVAGFMMYPLQSDSGSTAFSSRCQLGTDGPTISGFVVASGGPRWVLLRAVSASLANFGVASTVSRPSFTLYDSKSNVVGASSVWSSDPNFINGFKTVFSLVGDFPLSDGSDEGVLLVPLQPGAYTAVFKANGTGQILCEAYILQY